MSGLDGDALLAIIRSWKPHILVLVISVSIRPYIQKNCIDRGPSSFIAKPFAKTNSD
jgi:CheY-like chemotaxis protein